MSAAAGPDSAGAGLGSSNTRNTGATTGRAWLAALPGELAAQRRVMAGLIEFCEVTPPVTSLSVGCSYTIGFVIEEQAYLALVANGEWDDLVRELPRPDANESRRSSDAIALLSDDRRQRFRTGLETILTGTAA